MTLMEKLFSFKGRIRRRDYWLLNIASSIVFGVVILFSAMISESDGTTTLFGALLMIAASLAVIWIGFALLVKRWHDRDKSWFWVFIAFIPLIGGFWVLIECGILDGTQGPNRFGPSPKGLGGAENVF